jgi:Zn-dependent alcohol dehydrogenase
VRVAVAYEIGQPLVLEDLPVPGIRPRDVLVRVTASGICHTDLNVINGLSPLPLPIVPGHEGCGVVEEVGAEVRRVRVGDCVLASVTPACGLVGMPPVGATLTLPAIAAVFSGKRLAGSVVGGAQILRDFPRFVRLAEAGLLDLGSMISQRIKLDEINDGIGLLTRAEGVRTVVI